MTLIRGFRTELENLDGDAKGKGTSGSPTRPKVPMRRPGADCFVVAMNRINLRGAKGAGHPRRDQPESTGNRRNSLVSTEGGSLRWVARAAISRETYVRFCERPEVKFLGPTRRRAGDRSPYAYFREHEFRERRWKEKGIRIARGRQEFLGGSI